MKKIISFFIAMIMVSAIIMPGKVSGKNSPNYSLEKATTIAKQTFNLTTDGYDFNYNYSEGQDGKNIWRLSWSAKKAPKGTIEVVVDADTGEVLQMNRWDYSNTVPNKIPKYTKEQGLKVAQEIAQKLQTEKLKETKLVEDKSEKLIPYYYSPDSYSYKFIRQVNGLEFVDNGITIVLNKNTLEMISYNYQWDKGAFPDPTKALNIESAKKIYAEKLGIELSYRMIYDYENKKQNVILVYSLKNGSRPIDAISGEIINGSHYPIVEGYDKSMQASEAKGESVLTHEEQSTVDNNSNLISKEQATDVVNKYLPQTTSYKLNNANLYINSINKKASWDLSWNKEEENKGSTGYIHARVDAQNSELLSFYLYGSEYNSENKLEKPTFTKDMAKEIAENFIKQQQPEKFKTTEYRDFQESEFVEKYPASYYFTFTSKQNGALCPFDTFRVSVDAYTGKVMSYEMNWEDINLQSTNDSITLENAYNILFEKANFTMKYIRYYNYKDNNKPEIKLAYTLENFSGMIDSKTGVFLDYSGKPIKKVNKVEFSDIKGHKSENDIKLLVEMGILADENNKYYPNNSITQKDFIKMIVNTIEPYSNIYERGISEDEYERYYAVAIERKVISSKEKNPNSQISKQIAAKMLVRALGIGFIADIPDLYNLPFKDASLITNQYKGFTAIAHKLGIVQSENNNFKPQSHVSRGEAATMLVSFLKVDVNISEKF